VRIFQKICDEKNVALHQTPRQKNYQEYNTTLAAAIGKGLGIQEKHIVRGIQRTRLQCRFEIMQKNPLVVLDGAHNRAKVRSTIENLKQLDFRKLHLIIGTADSKDKISILEQIAPLADRIMFTRFQIKDRKCAHPKELLALSRRYLKVGVKHELFLDPEQALAGAFRQAAKKDLILAVGSFFLTGELRKNWIAEEKILRTRKNQ
jgi:folylpolyglutamate synthase/dihydropteroate synthase